MSHDYDVRQLPDDDLYLLAELGRQTAKNGGLAPRPARREPVLTLRDRVLLQMKARRDAEEMAAAHREMAADRRITKHMRKSGAGPFAGLAAMFAEAFRDED